MTIKVLISHSQVPYNRAIQVLHTTASGIPLESMGEGTRRTLCPGETGEFYVHSGQSLAVREMPDDDAQATEIDA